MSGPVCATCRDTKYVPEPIVPQDFAPTVNWVPCPDCNLEPESGFLGMSNSLFATILTAILVVVLLWCLSCSRSC
jgi:hypothetical protein